MKLSRDTRRAQLTASRIAAVIRLDARLHLTHIALDAYYDDPPYLTRWVHAIRAVGLHVWFRAHWYGWENHRDSRASMSPQRYISATRHFLQHHADLLANGDIFDFCAEPENGAYWLGKYGHGWSWRNRWAKTEFNKFIRSGVYMAQSTLANRGLDGVLVTAISMDASVATRLLSKPTVRRLKLITLDLYPEHRTENASQATKRLLSEIALVHKRWQVPILLGEHGYPRDVQVSDAIQVRVIDTELQALARLPYLRGLNYWVDAGGPGFGGYTNILRWDGHHWTTRPAAAILAHTFAQHE